jgi:YegS/Rv2252/BmrU family lipid kinase
VDGDPFLLVVNPRAGAGRAKRHLPALLAAFRDAGARFDLAQTTAPEDATRLVREALGRGTRGIAVVGGDGTLSEALHGFFDEKGLPIDRKAWFAPLSCGTGGDFRKTIGSIDIGKSGRSIEELVRRVLGAEPRPIDVGWIEHLDHRGRPAARAFLNIASFGISGWVDRLVSDTPKWMGGTAAFFIGTVRALARYRAQAVRITVDDRPPRETRIVTVAVANGRCFGGGMQIAPQARIDDGLFDVVGLEMSVCESIALAARIYTGTHLGRRGVTFDRARRVHAEPLQTEEPVLLDVDGEVPGRLPATFELRPGAILLRG